MPKQVKRTYVCLMLDRSGSMKDKIEETVQGFNEQVQQIRINSRDMETYVSLVTFNGNVFEHLWNEPTANLSLTSAEDYEPEGSTSYWDAFGYVIKKYKETTDVNDVDNAYVVIMISDGKDNASAHYGGYSGPKPALVAMVEAAQETNRWTFTGVGCSLDVAKEMAKAMRIPAANLAAYDTGSKAGTKVAYSAAAAKLGSFLRDRATRGITSKMDFFNEGSEEVADLSTPAAAEMYACNTIPTERWEEPKTELAEAISVSKVLGAGRQVKWSTK